MPELSIRQSGGASIVSIPKPILKSLGLAVGSVLDVSVEDHKIVLSPVSREVTLDELLAGSPKNKLKIRAEDKVWLGSSPVGKELL